MAATNKELCLAGVVLLAIPIFAEVALRATHFTAEPQLYRPSRERGWTLRPNAEGLANVETSQQVRINTLGFRDRERHYEKPSDVLRIAVLGNSWTEALQVPVEKTYVAVLEELLNQRACFLGRRVEVLNFGVAGYSTAQELLILQQEVWKYHPDVVLLAFYSARDVANNVRELNNAANPEQAPYFVYQNGTLVLDESFRYVPALQDRNPDLQEWKLRTSDHVRLLQAISAMQQFGKMQIALSELHAKADQAGLDNLEYSIYAAPTQATLEKAWQVTEGLLQLMNAEVRAHGAQFQIVTLANRPQVTPDAEKRKELKAKLNVKDLNYPDVRIRKLGAREGIRVTNLAPALLAYAEEHQAYLNGFTAKNLGAGHWNETGHRLAAETIASELCAELDGTHISRAGAP